MTPPEQPEVRLSPDGRLIAYCRSQKHGLWRKSDGYDCEAEDVAGWTLLVPAVSPAPDTDLREQIEMRLAWTPYRDVEHARSEVVDAVLPLLAERDAEIQRLTERVAEQHDINQGWARYGERVKADRARYGDMLIDALGITERVGRWFEHLVPQACAEIARLRAERDEARAEVERLHLEVQAHQVSEGYERGHEHGVQAGLAAAARSAPAADPAPVAERQWGVRIDGSSVQRFDTEAEARSWMEWTAPRADQSVFEVVTRMTTPWQAAVSVAPAEPSELEEYAATLVLDHARHITDQAVREMAPEHLGREITDEEAKAVHDLVATADLTVEWSRPAVTHPKPTPNTPPADLAGLAARDHLTACTGHGCCDDYNDDLIPGQPDIKEP
ncbi:hypothetical protein JOF41_007324 [Saccharothrix coeruleofusca]|uniref:hypothetical protein n=1 Tax=Saccharothrix coeruleofusca TaxID=33919 RepID=UPI001AE8F1A7|nr:hypothetical protein [Saccharothrix coeruleofusca]MBP2341070.1 hypothetical protein [Saccharothrix coeruleofusca]